MHRSQPRKCFFYHLLLLASYTFHGRESGGGTSTLPPGFQLSTVVHTDKMFIRYIIYFVIFFIPCFYGCKTNYPPIEKNNTRIPLTEKKNCSGGSIFYRNTSHVTLKCCEEIEGCLYNLITALMLVVAFVIIFGVFMLRGNWTGRNNPTPDENKNKKNNKKNNQEENV